ARGLSTGVGKIPFTAKTNEGTILPGLVGGGDANNAFLYGDIVEDVYMTLPLGFGNNSDNKVYKLNKSLYGFKQSPRQWNAKLTAALVEHGFVHSKFDYSLFIKETEDVFVVLLVYVDDIVIIEKKALSHLNCF
nr:ribonuclease H-like domain-containing protein [Tanacetum cinerariifolium]